jgi:hypothetical protein
MYDAGPRVAFAMSVAGGRVRAEGYVIDETIDDDDGRRLHVSIGGERVIVHEDDVIK